MFSRLESMTLNIIGKFNADLAQLKVKSHMTLLVIMLVIVNMLVWLYITIITIM